MFPFTFHHFTEESIPNDLLHPANSKSNKSEKNLTNHSSVYYEHDSFQFNTLYICPGCRDTGRDSFVSSPNFHPVICDQKVRERTRTEFLSISRGWSRQFVTNSLLIDSLFIMLAYPLKSADCISCFNAALDNYQRLMNSPMWRQTKNQYTKKWHKIQIWSFLYLSITAQQ